MKTTNDMKRVLIAGAGVAGRMLLEEIENQPDLYREVVGFVDDDPNKEIVAGVKVLGETDDLPDIIEQKTVDEVIIAMPSAAGSIIRRITRQAAEFNADLRIVPGIREIIDGDVSWKQIRNIKTEDLLGRETVSVDEKRIEDYLGAKTVLITGAAGSIGGKLVERVLEHKPDLVVGLDINESGLYELEMANSALVKKGALETVLADVRDAQLVDSIVSKFSPDLILHAAALKHVPMLERYPAEAVKTNIQGTLNVFEAAHKQRISDCLLISTDKAVEPCNVMGLTKRLGEYLVGSYSQKESKTRYRAVRFGNVLGSRGSVVPLFKKQIESGGPVTVTDPEVVRYFMTLDEAVKLVLTATTFDNGGMIYVLDLGEQVSILDLARQLISLSGYRPETEIPIVFTGLRPGEKMEEKLIADTENSVETEHNLIQEISAPCLNSKQDKKLKIMLKAARQGQNNFKNDLTTLLK